MKILHFRKDCIGCNVCVEHAPDYWKISETDGKADLLNSLERNGEFSREIKFGDLEKIKLAEKDCPMNIIKIQGKK